MTLTIMAPFDEHLAAHSADVELIRRWTETGDRSALETALRPHLDSAWRLARRMSSTTADAEDILQDACMQAVCKAQQFRGNGSLRSWFFGIVANAARMKHRAEERRRAHLPEPPSDNNGENDPDGLGERALAALEKIPQHERIAVWLHSVEGLSYEEMSLALKQREVTVRSHVSRGLERLRQMLTPRSATLSVAAVTAALATVNAETVPETIISSALNTLGTAPAISTKTATIGWIATASIVVLGMITAFFVWPTSTTSVTPPQSVIAAPPPPPVLPTAASVRVLGDSELQEPSQIQTIAIDPNGRLLATCVYADSGHKVNLWSLADRTRYWSVIGNEPCWLADGTLAVHVQQREKDSLIESSEIEIWNVHMRQRLRTIPIERGQLIHKLFVAPDGVTIFATWEDRTFDLDQTRRNTSDKGRKGHLLAINTGSGNVTAMVKNIARQHEMMRYDLNAVDVSGEGKKVFCLDSWTGGQQIDRSSHAFVIAWPSGERLATWQMPRRSNPHAQWLNDGSVLLAGTADADNRMKSVIIDPMSGTVRHAWNGIATLTADHRVLCAAPDAFMRFDPLTGTGERLCDINEPLSRWWARAVTAGDWFVATTNSNAPLIIDVKRPSVLTGHRHANVAPTVRYLADGTLAVGCWYKRYLYDVTGKVSQIGMPKLGISASASDRILIGTQHIAKDDSTQPVVWDLATRTELHRLPTRSGIDSLWLSEDASLVAVEGEYDGRLKVYELPNRSQRFSVVGPGMSTLDFGPSQMDITGLRWNRDRSRMYVADKAGIIARDKVRARALTMSRPYRLTGIRDAQTGALIHPFTFADGTPVDIATDLDFNEQSSLVYLVAKKAWFDDKNPPHWEQTDKPIAGLWRASDGAFVRAIATPKPEVRLRFNYDRTLLVGNIGAIAVATGEVVRFYDSGSASPSGTLHATLRDDGVLVVRDLRDGIELLRRPWHVPRAGDQPGHVAWSPGERQIAINFADNVAVLQIDLTGAEGADAPGDHLDSDDAQQRSAAIDAYARGGIEALASLRHHLDWKTTTATPGTRAAIQSLDALAQRDVPDALALLRDGQQASDATVARWTREALIRVEAGRKATHLREAWSRQPQPFEWPHATPPRTVSSSATPDKSDF